MLAGTALLIVACNGKKPEEKHEGLGINLQNIDTAVRPQDDFFKYVNGGWIPKGKAKKVYQRTLKSIVKQL